VSTDDDDTAAMITALATATNLIHAAARDARSTAPELEAADLYTLGAVLDELTSTLAHIADQCAAATGNYPGRSHPARRQRHPRSRRPRRRSRRPPPPDQQAPERSQRGCPPVHAAIGHVGAEVQR